MNPVVLRPRVEELGKPKRDDVVSKRLARDPWHAWKIEEYSHLYDSAGDAEPTYINAEEERLSLSYGKIGVAKPSSASSRLTQLPREVLDLIVHNLDSALEIGLRHSCRQLYFRCGTDSLLSLKCRTRVDADHSVRLAWRSISLWFTENTRIPSKSLFCSACKIPHPRPVFSKEEARRLPRRRTCLGHLGQLRLAFDHKVTFTDLYQIRQPLGPAIPINFHRSANNEFMLSQHPALVRCCVDSSVQIGPRRPHLHSGTSQSAPFIHLWLSHQTGDYDAAEYQEWCKDKTRKCSDLYDVWPRGQPRVPLFYLRYSWHFYTEVSMTGNYSVHSVMDHLKQHVIRFCPHVSSIDPAVRKAVCAPRLRASFPDWVGSEMRCKKCKTRLRFTRGIEECCLAVEVTRYLGTLESAGEAQWLANIE